MDDDDVEVQMSASTKDSMSQEGSDKSGDNFFIEDDDDYVSDNDGENSKEDEREEESDEGVEGGEDDDNDEDDDDDNNDDDSYAASDSDEIDEDDDIFADIEKDRDVDVFLIFEELVEKRYGEQLPKAQMNLCEFLHPDREYFVDCYHIVAVHPAAQIYLVRDLHKTVHGGLLRPALKPFIEALLKRVRKVHYYSSLELKHSNDFLTIRNGRKASKLKPFRSLDFNLALSKVNKDVVGQHWNSQCTWGFSSLNFRRLTPSDAINSPSIKKENVDDGILPQFAALSELLQEVDGSNKYY
jgi:hypothetical protein